MKKLLLTIIMLSGYLTVFTQEEMPEVWQAKLEHKISFSGTGLEDRGYSYAASEKEMTVLKMTMVKSFGLNYSRNWRQNSAKLMS